MVIHRILAVKPVVHIAVLGSQRQREGVGPSVIHAGGDIRRVAIVTAINLMAGVNAVIAALGADDEFVDVETGVNSHCGSKVPAFVESVLHELKRIGDDTAIVPPEALARGKDVDGAALTVESRPDHVEFGAESVACTAAQIKPVAVIWPGIGGDGHRIGREFIGSFVRRVEHRIIEMIIETQQRIRNPHSGTLLRSIPHTGLILVRHLHLGVKVLASEAQGKQHCGKNYNVFFHTPISCLVCKASTAPDPGYHRPDARAYSRHGYSQG